jgi:Cytochrome c1
MSLRRWLVGAAVFGLLFAAGARAEGPARAGWQPFSADPGNVASLQRGARNFMNYCAGCHSLKYLRYERMREDLDIPEGQFVEALRFEAKFKPGDPVISAMASSPASRGFGKPPPDLSLVARARGAAWIYNYLQDFYLEDGRMFGVNNLELEGVSMPDVLWRLQGWQKLGKDESGSPRLVMVQAGTMTPRQFRGFVADLTNFLVYVGSPNYRTRISVGFGAVLYLAFFTVLAYLLKRETWRDVH